MNEVEQQVEKEEEIQIEVIDEEVSQDTQPAQETVASDDELDEYTRGVSKRINKLNARARDAEARAEQYENLAKQKDQRIKDLESQAATLNESVITAEERAIEARERQADELFKKAYESGDAELISKADTLKNDIAIQKEQVKLAKNRKQQAPEPVQEVEEQNYQQQPVVPTEEALMWKSRNPWYGADAETNNVEATQYANYTHINLVNEGYEPDSDEYYNELDKRVYNVYPDLMNTQNAKEKEVRPTVQRVASASVGSRQKTQGNNKNGVTFSKSEKERLLGLKPYNMSEEDWLKQVAKQKQKIQQKEAR